MATTPPTPPAPGPVGRGALSPSQAADWLGIARSTFYAQVLGDLRVVQLGRRKLIFVQELERWLERMPRAPSPTPVSDHPEAEGRCGGGRG